jgi:hypothetical protein
MKKLTHHLSTHSLLLMSVCLLGLGIVFSEALAGYATGYIWSGTYNSTVGGNDPQAYTGAGWFQVDTQTVDVTKNLIIPEGNGDVAGYAWSGGNSASSGEFYGWLSFNGTDVTNAPACSPALGQAKRVGNTLEGGARILAIRTALIAGNSGGMDGCVSLKGVTSPGGEPYGVVIDPVTGKLSGQAWSDDLGWLDFSQVSIAPAGIPDGTLACATAPDGDGICTCTITSPSTSCSPQISWSVNASVLAGELREGGVNKLSTGAGSTAGTYTVLPALNPGSGIKTYTLFAQPLSGGAFVDTGKSVQVRAGCANPTVWNGSTCAMPLAPDGTITVRDPITNATSSPACVIPIGASSCQRKVEWTANSAVTVASFRVNGAQVQSGGPNSSGSDTFTFSQGATLVELYNITGTAITFLRGVNINATCEGTWNASLSICEATLAPGGVITPSTCIVPNGQSTCTATIDWTVNAMVTSPVFKETKDGVTNTIVAKPYSRPLSMKADGTGESAEYNLYNGANPDPLDTKTVTATCEVGHTVNLSTGKCAPIGTLSGTLNGSGTCTIPEGQGACPSFTFNANITGVYDTASVANVTANPDTIYGPLAMGANPNILSKSWTTNTITQQGETTITYQIVANVGGVYTPVSNTEATRTVTSTCASDTSWDIPTNTCKAVAVPVTGQLEVESNPTFNPTGCQNMVDGSSECRILIDWNSTATNVNVLRQKQGEATWTTIYPNANPIENDQSDIIASAGVYTYRLQDADTSATLGTDRTFTMSCSNTWSETEGKCIGNSFGYIDLKDASDSRLDPQTCAIPLNQSNCVIPNIVWAVAYTKDPTLYRTSMLETANPIMSRSASEGSALASDTASDVIMHFGNNVMWIESHLGNKVPLRDTVTGVESQDVTYYIDCESGAKWSYTQNKCVSAITPQ